MKLFLIIMFLVFTVPCAKSGDFFVSVRLSIPTVVQTPPPVIVYRPQTAIIVRPVPTYHIYQPVVVSHSVPIYHMPVYYSHSSVYYSSRPVMIVRPHVHSYRNNYRRSR